MAIKQNIPPERMSDGKYILDETEKVKILEGWKNGILDLKKLSEYVWPGMGLDGRAYQPRAMKVFLAERNYAPIPAQTYQKKSEDPLLQLKESEKEFITNHAPELKPMEIAKRLWGDLPLGDLRVKLCLEYYKELPKELWNNKYLSTTKEYNGPKTATQVIARLRQYKLCDWEEDKISVHQKNCIKKLIEFSNLHRFETDMSCIKDQRERDLVECEFFRHVYDKPDLSNEDISIYINAVFTILDIKRLREDEASGREMIANSVDDEGKYRFNQPLVEYVNNISSQISARQAKLESSLNKLNGERSKRLENQGGKNISLASLVDVWKEKDKRDKVIALVEARQKKLEGELSELKSMSALKFEMWGANSSEILK